MEYQKEVIQQNYQISTPELDQRTQMVGKLIQSAPLHIGVWLGMVPRMWFYARHSF